VLTENRIRRRTRNDPGGCFVIKWATPVLDQSTIKTFRGKSA